MLRQLILHLQFAKLLKRDNINMYILCLWTTEEHINVLASLELCELVTLTLIPQLLHLSNRS